MSPQPKNDSLWNWLGRQIGHVKKAVTTDVTKPALPASPSPQPAPAAAPDKPRGIYRDEKAEEGDLPDRPGGRWRPTEIDEVMGDDKPNEHGEVTPSRCMLPPTSRIMA